MAPADIKRLTLIRERTDSVYGMYPGIHWDDAPAQHGRLSRLGLIRAYDPPNMMHKTRVVITDAGRAALKGTGHD